MQRLISTESVPPGDRLAYWMDFVCAQLMRLDCQTLADSPQNPFFGEMTWREMARLSAVRMRVRVDGAQDGSQPLTIGLNRILVGLGGRKFPLPESGPARPRLGDLAVHERGHEEWPGSWPASARPLYALSHAVVRRTVSPVVRSPCRRCGLVLCPGY